MKLDKSVVNTILSIAYHCDEFDLPYKVFSEKIQEIDLVFKPGDASQSILVENVPKNKEVDWSEVYNKEK